MNRTILFPLLCLALSGCVQHRQWRTEPFYGVGAKAGVKNELRMVIPPSADDSRFYSIAFVEFKNDGDAWDKRQLDEALHAIDDADKRSGHRALVITFIHGWKNNAKTENNNVIAFRKQLNRIAAQACPRGPAACGVVGIYMAWSGDAINSYWPTLRTFTYPDRRNTARKVASPPIADALFAVMKRVKEGKERETNHSVVVGHSFGGLILEFAISKRMAELGDQLSKELGKRRAGEGLELKATEDFADLVVLINQAAPATEAVKLLDRYHAELQGAHIPNPAKRTNCAGFSPQDCKELSRPLILSVSSESDFPTRSALPIVEKVLPPPGPKEDFSKIKIPGLENATIATAAAAHTPVLHSHHLYECTGPLCAECEKKDSLFIPISFVLPALASGNIEHKDKPMNYCLARDPKAWNQTPYWIFRLPPEIVPDHSEIFTDRFTDFLTAFLPPLGSFGGAGALESPGAAPPPRTPQRMIKR